MAADSGIADEELPRLPTADKDGNVPDNPDESTYNKIETALRDAGVTL